MDVARINGSLSRLPRFNIFGALSTSAVGAVSAGESVKGQVILPGDAHLPAYDTKVLFSQRPLRVAVEWPLPIFGTHQSLSQTHSHCGTRSKVRHSCLFCGFCIMRNVVAGPTPTGCNDLARRGEGTRLRLPGLKPVGGGLTLGLAP